MSSGWATEVELDAHPADQQRPYIPRPDVISRRKQIWEAPEDRSVHPVIRAADLHG